MQGNDEIRRLCKSHKTMFNETTSSVVSSLSKISVDIFGVLGVVILLVALGLANGKKTLIVILLSLYPAALVTEFFPFYGGVPFITEVVPIGTEPLVLFILSEGVTIFIIKNYIETTFQIRSFWRFVEITALSIATVGLGIALLYHIVDIDTFYNSSIILDSLFSSPTALWLWLVAPLASISLFVRA